MLDSAGGSVIKVLPVTSSDMLQKSVDEIIWSPEIDWSQPAEGNGLGAATLLGGGWGQQRVVTFSGLK